MFYLYSVYIALSSNFFFLFQDLPPIADEIGSASLDSNTNALNSVLSMSPGSLNDAVVQSQATENRDFSSVDQVYIFLVTYVLP